jgi:Lar family restriction alleviation protein
VKHGFIAKITLKAAKNARQKVRRLRGMENELKPCPFCGGEAEHKMYFWGNHTKTHKPIWCYYIFCAECGAMTDNIFKTEEEAITAWNRRVKE